MRSVSSPATIRKAPVAGWAFGDAAATLATRAVAIARRYERLGHLEPDRPTVAATGQRRVTQLWGGGKVDQCVRELLLSADELEPVRLELVGARVVRMQRLSHRHEHEDCFL